MNKYLPLVGAVWRRFFSGQAHILTDTKEKGPSNRQMEGPFLMSNLPGVYLYTGTVNS